MNPNTAHLLAWPDTHRSPHVPTPGSYTAIRGAIGGDLTVPLPCSILRTFVKICLFTECSVHINWICLWSPQRWQKIGWELLNHRGIEEAEKGHAQRERQWRVSEHDWVFAWGEQWQWDKECLTTPKHGGPTLCQTLDWALGIQEWWGRHCPCPQEGHGLHQRQPDEGGDCNSAIEK